MIHEVRPNELLLWLYLSCGFGGVVYLSVLLAGSVTANSKSPVATQRARYFWAALVVPVAAVALYLPLHKYSIGECVSTLGEARDLDFAFGWALTIAFYGLLASPVLAILVGIRVYYKPAMYATRNRGRYPLTSYERFRRQQRRRFRRAINPNRSNRL